MTGPAITERVQRSGTPLSYAIFLYIVDEMSREAVGTFELMVLLAALRVGQDAYGVVISREIETSTKRSVLIGSVYAALERLEAKGLIRHRLGEATPERGGRAKKYFTVTAKGVRAARETRQQLVGLWTGVPALEGGTR